MRRNDIPLSPHFSLREFENPDGWCMVHPSVIASLEGVHSTLSAVYGAVAIIITGSTRTAARNAELARVHGWQGEGGTVSRDSRHLEQYGGIAVDLRAKSKVNGRRIPQDVLAEACRVHFDYVKADYADGHVHADNRKRGKV